MTSCVPRASARHQLGAAPALCLLLELLAVSFPHNICLLPLEDPGREGGCLGHVHRLRGLHWEEVGCGGGGGTGGTAVTPRALPPQGSADTLRPVTAGHTLAQPSTHHMFLLEYRDTSPCLLHDGPRTPSLCRDRAPFLAPSAPSGRHQGMGFGTLPSDQPTIGTGCWWQQSGDVTSGTTVRGALCLLGRCGVLQEGTAGQVRGIKCAGGCTPAPSTSSPVMAVLLIPPVLGRAAAMNSRSINVTQPYPSLSINGAINTLRPGKPSPGRARRDTKEDTGSCWLSEPGRTPACTH